MSWKDSSRKDWMQVVTPPGAGEVPKWIHRWPAESASPLSASSEVGFPTGSERNGRHVPTCSIKVMSSSFNSAGHRKSSVPFPSLSVPLSQLLQPHRSQQQHSEWAKRKGRAKEKWREIKPKPFSPWLSRALVWGRFESDEMLKF